MPPELEEKLSVYLELLRRWQKTLNLVSHESLQEARTRHFEGSLQLLPFIDGKVHTLVDMGSGAGFPGLVLAMALPEKDIHLVESDVRKCAFLQTVSRETKTGVQIHNSRIEQLNIGADLVTARALAPLARLFELGEKFFLVNASCRALFLKGAHVDEEIKSAKEEWCFSLDKYPSITNRHGSILEIHNISRCAKS